MILILNFYKKDTSISYSYYSVESLEGNLKNWILSLDNKNDVLMAYSEFKTEIKKYIFMATVYVFLH